MGGGGAKHFSSWKVNDAHDLTILVKEGRHFFKLQGGGGEAKSKPATESPEHVFMLLIAWSLIDLEICGSQYGRTLTTDIVVLYTIDRLLN